MDNDLLSNLTLPTIPGLLRSVESVHPDYTLYRYIGMPYGGLVEGKFDFHRTFFSPRTDVGPLGRGIDNFFDHGMFPGIGFEPIGRATILEEENPEGKLFDIMVKKSNKYHDLVYNLYNEGILFGSAQAIASSYRIDPKTGEVLRFIPAEWSFTVTPSNLLARPITVVRSVAQNIFTQNNLNESDFNIWFASRGFDLMEENTTLNTVAVSPLSTADAAVVEPAVPVQTETTETTVTTEQEAQPQRSVTERVEEIIQRAETRVPAIEATDDQTARILHNMATVIRALYDENHTLVETLTTMQTAQAEREDALSQRLQSIEDSIVRSAEASLEMVSRALQENVVRALQDEVVTPLLGASQDERTTYLRRQNGQGKQPVTTQTNPQIPTVKAAPPGLSN